MRRPRHFHVWRARRAVWGVLVGLSLILATTLRGAFAELPPYETSSWSAFTSERPALAAMHCDSTWASAFVAFGSDFHTMMEQGWGKRFRQVPDIASLREFGIAIPHRAIDRMTTSTDQFEQYRVGVPFRCFSGEVVGTLGRPDADVNRFLIVIKPNKIHDWVHLPYRPLPGLALSWAFWAAVAYIGMTGISFVRVHRRLRRGKCPACAYVMAGLARCPECGTVVREEGDDGLEARPTEGMCCLAEDAGTARPAG